MCRECRRVRVELDVELDDDTLRNRSLTLAFTDCHWFNAVEAEVYAMATCILSALFWMALRWENEMNTPRGDRWLLLIAFVIGLSFGVHFMGLLTIPAIGMLYYFKNTSKVTLKGFLTANILSVAILLFIFKNLDSLL